MRGERAPSYGPLRSVRQPEDGFILSRAAELWRPIPQFPAYEIEISSHGVRRRSTGKILQPWFVGGFYPYVGLRRGGRTFKRLVHRLYAAAFLDLAPGQEIDHRRGRVSTRRAIIRALPGKHHSSVYKRCFARAQSKVVRMH
jgi:hypothetical protein